MPWQSGFVPSDGYRMYIHGTSYKMEFEPCGHKIEDYCEENVSHSNNWASEEMEKIRQQMIFNAGQIQRLRMFPHEVKEMQMNKIQCPYCDEKSTGMTYKMNVDHSEMPERQFKASRIMGWC
jgi:hypothetical protein